MARGTSVSLFGALTPFGLLRLRAQPTLIELGTGTDEDDYVYDPNTGRMTNWTFNVGSSNEAATLTWNANGTLRTLAITDGFNSGGTQTCNFGTSSVMGYDDLGRLLSDNCGSVWAQTFSYDQYDNLTKSGSITWNPGYSSSNNHYTLSGTSYDSSGNLKTDTFHTYVWNGFNKIATIDSTACGTNGECITYDASGRAVEVSSGSSYTEIWYTPMGKSAVMNGATLVDATISMPGGGTLFQKPGGFYYYQHKDWLGSARLSSTVAGHTIVADRAFAPYGEMYQNFGATDELNFTGDTQDIVAGMFDTPNRELAPNQGRWISPDPAGAGWNLYAYATNPNSAVDPSGLCLLVSGDGGCSGGIAGGLHPRPQVPFGWSGGGESVYVVYPCFDCIIFGDQVGGTVAADDGSSTVPTTNLPVSSSDWLDAGLNLAAAVDSVVLGPGDQLPTTIVQVGYVVPDANDPNASFYGPDGGYASIKYQTFDDHGNPVANAWVGENLFQLDGSVRAAPKATWRTDAQGNTYDYVGMGHVDVNSSDYNIEEQQFYINQNGAKFFLTPTYTQTSYYSNGILTVIVTPNGP